MSEGMVSAIVQLVIALGGAGLLVQLLLLRQNRRKIAGEASTNEANAASTLSGAALKMVENAQANQREAEDRADRAEARLVERQAEFDARRERDAQELERRAWRIHHLEMRVAVIVHALRQLGVEPPPEPVYDYPTEVDPPALEGGPTPAP